MFSWALRINRKPQGAAYLSAVPIARLPGDSSRRGTALICQQCKRVTDSPQLADFKRRAKALKKAEGKKYAEALEALAEREGYLDYAAAHLALKGDA